MRLPRLILSAVLLLSAGFAAAQEPATTNRQTELRERASADAKAISNLAEGTAVKVLSRSGGWTEVDVQGKKGWVRVFHLRFPTSVQSAPSSGGSVLGGIGSLFGGNRGRTEEAKVANIGIRGLTPEELKNANPNPEALRRMQSFRADVPGAERFAREAKLSPQRVAYADEAKR